MSGSEDSDEEDDVDGEAYILNRFAEAIPVPDAATSNQAVDSRVGLGATLKGQPRMGTFRGTAAASVPPTRGRRAARGRRPTAVDGDAPQRFRAGRSAEHSAEASEFPAAARISSSSVLHAELFRRIRERRLRVMSMSATGQRVVRVATDYSLADGGAGVYLNLEGQHYLLVTDAELPQLLAMDVSCDPAALGNVDDDYQMTDSVETEVRRYKEHMRRAGDAAASRRHPRASIPRPLVPPELQMRIAQPLPDGLVQRQAVPSFMLMQNDPVRLDVAAACGVGMEEVLARQLPIAVSIPDDDGPVSLAVLRTELAVLDPPHHRLDQLPPVDECGNLLRTRSYKKLPHYRAAFRRGRRCFGKDPFDLEGFEEKFGVPFPEDAALQLQLRLYESDQVISRQVPVVFKWAIPRRTFDELMLPRRSKAKWKVHKAEDGRAKKNESGSYRAAATAPGVLKDIFSLYNCTCQVCMYETMTFSLLKKDVPEPLDVEQAWAYARGVCCDNSCRLNYYFIIPIDMSLKRRRKDDVTLWIVMQSNRYLPTHDATNLSQDHGRSVPRALSWLPSADDSDALEELAVAAESEGYTAFADCMRRSRRGDNSNGDRDESTVGADAVTRRPFQLRRRHPMSAVAQRRIGEALDSGRAPQQIANELASELPTQRHLLQCYGTTPSVEAIRQFSRRRRRGRGSLPLAEMVDELQSCFALKTAEYALPGYVRETTESADGIFLQCQEEFNWLQTACASGRCVIAGDSTGGVVNDFGPKAATHVTAFIAVVEDGLGNALHSSVVGQWMTTNKDYASVERGFLALVDILRRVAPDLPRPIAFISDCEWALRKSALRAFNGMSAAEYASFTSRILLGEATVEEITKCTFLRVCDSHFLQLIKRTLGRNCPDDTMAGHSGTSRDKRRLLMLVVQYLVECTSEPAFAEMMQNLYVVLTSPKLLPTVVTATAAVHDALTIYDVPRRVGPGGAVASGGIGTREDLWPPLVVAGEEDDLDAEIGDVAASASTIKANNVYWLRLRGRITDYRSGLLAEDAHDARVGVESENPLYMPWAVDLLWTNWMPYLQWWSSIMFNPARYGSNLSEVEVSALDMAVPPRFATTSAVVESFFALLKRWWLQAAGSKGRKMALDDVLICLYPEVRRLAKTTLLAYKTGLASVTSSKKKAKHAEPVPRRASVRKTRASSPHSSSPRDPPGDPRTSTPTSSAPRRSPSVERQEPSLASPSSPNSPRERSGSSSTNDEQSVNSSASQTAAVNSEAEVADAASVAADKATTGAASDAAAAESASPTDASPPENTFEAGAATAADNAPPRPPTSAVAENASTREESTSAAIDNVALAADTAPASAPSKAGQSCSANGERPPSPMQAETAAEAAPEALMAGADVAAATAARAVPVTQPATVSSAVPVGQVATAARAVPVGQAATAARAVPVTQAATAARAVPVTQAATAASAVPVTQAATAASAVPVTQAATAASAVPLAQAETAARAVPVTLAASAAPVGLAATAVPCNETTGQPSASEPAPKRRRRATKQRSPEPPVLSTSTPTPSPGPKRKRWKGRFLPTTPAAPSVTATSAPGTVTEVNVDEPSAAELSDDDEDRVHPRADEGHGLWRDKPQEQPENIRDSTLYKWKEPSATPRMLTRLAAKVYGGLLATNSTDKVVLAATAVRGSSGGGRVMGRTKAATQVGSNVEACGAKKMTTRAASKVSTRSASTAEKRLAGKGVGRAAAKAASDGAGRGATSGARFGRGRSAAPCAAAAAQSRNRLSPVPEEADAAINNTAQVPADDGGRGHPDSSTEVAGVSRPPHVDAEEPAPRPPNVDAEEAAPRPPNVDAEEAAPLPLNADGEEAAPLPLNADGEEAPPRPPHVDGEEAARPGEVSADEWPVCSSSSRTQLTVGRAQEYSAYVDYCVAGSDCAFAGQRWSGEKCLSPPASDVTDGSAPWLIGATEALEARRNPVTVDPSTGVLVERPGGETLTQAERAEVLSLGGCLSEKAVNVFQSRLKELFPHYRGCQVVSLASQGLNSAPLQDSDPTRPLLQVLHLGGSAAGHYYLLASNPKRKDDDDYLIYDSMPNKTCIPSTQMLDAVCAAARIRGDTRSIKLRVAKVTQQEPGSNTCGLMCCSYMWCVAVALDPNCEQITADQSLLRQRFLDCLDKRDLSLLSATVQGFDSNDVSRSMPAGYYRLFPSKEAYEEANAAGTTEVGGMRRFIVRVGCVDHCRRPSIVDEMHNRNAVCFACNNFYHKECVIGVPPECFEIPTFLANKAVAKPTALFCCPSCIAARRHLDGDGDVHTRPVASWAPIVDTRGDVTAKYAGFVVASLRRLSASSPTDVSAAVVGAQPWLEVLSSSGEVADEVIEAAIAASTLDDTQQVLLPHSRDGQSFLLRVLPDASIVEFYGPGLSQAVLAKECARSTRLLRRLMEQSASVVRRDWQVVMFDISIFGDARQSAAYVCLLLKCIGHGVPPYFLRMGSQAEAYWLESIMNDLDFEQVIPACRAKKPLSFCL